jgi:hypothetical protein
LQVVSPKIHAISRGFPSRVYQRFLKVAYFHILDIFGKTTGYFVFRQTISRDFEKYGHYPEKIPDREVTTPRGKNPTHGYALFQTEWF